MTPTRYLELMISCQKQGFSQVLVYPCSQYMTLPKRILQIPMGVPEKVLLLAKPRHQAPGLVSWSYRGPPGLSEAIFGLLIA